ncbi:MAG: Smr/MutS family protein [Gammaproteobacteria bacterium]
MDIRRIKALHKQTPEQSLDLHGLTAAEAEAVLDDFLRRQRAEGRRHVEVIHGKGAHGAGVLRLKTREWLAQSGAVLGYEEARRNSGAVRVLLRRA